MKDGFPSALIFLPISFLISACNFSPKFDGPKFDRDLKVLKVDPNKKVFVALTNAKLERSQRSGFDKRSKEIFENLKSYPGYMGGTVKIQVLGDEVWTMTVWEDQSSLDKFVESSRHRDSVQTTGHAMKQFKHLRKEVPAKDLPYSWEQAQKLLNEIPFEGE